MPYKSPINTVLAVLLLVFTQSSKAQPDPLLNAVLSDPDYAGFAQSLSEGGFWQNNYSHIEAETLIALADKLTEENNFEAAERAYLQAAQIAKINYGLFAIEQLPGLKGVVSTLIEQKKWDALDEQLSYLQWLVRRNFQSQPDQFASHLSLISEWVLEAANQASRENQSFYLVKARTLNWQAAGIIERHYGMQDIRLVPVYYDIVLNHYAQSILRYRNGLTSHNFKSDDRSFVNGWSLSKSESVSNSYYIGLELLSRIERLFRLSPNYRSQTLGLVGLYKSDWNYLFGHQAKAEQGYASVHQLLQEADLSAADIETIVASETALPLSEIAFSWDDYLSAIESAPQLAHYKEKYEGIITGNQEEDYPIRFRPEHVLSKQ